MKKCPYCAEMIQDEAIKCRYCHSDLTIVPPVSTSATPSGPSPTLSEAGPAEAGTVQGPSAGSGDQLEPIEAEGNQTSRPIDAQPTDAQPTDAQPASAQLGASSSPSPTPDASSVRYTHSGFRYVLGYGADFFGIWDRQSPSVPTERFSRTDDGWRDAWLRFASLEPNHATVPADGGPAAAQSHPSVVGAGAIMEPDDMAAVQYTHSGTRYLLGYGRTFFGIWDRQAPDRPAERFARDDAGWADAWRRYTQLETNFTEVKLS